MVEVVGRLNMEDLARWRMVQAKIHAIEVNPGVYSAAETERAFMDAWTLSEMLVEQYGLDDTEDWAISVVTGVVCYKS